MEVGMQRESAGNRLVLIAERDKHVRELESYFLVGAGFAVEFADDGQAALAQARLVGPALVITEILLPKIDGLTLCRHLREDPSTRDVPVIVFSILAAGARAREAGASAFLRKPFIESQFLATVDEVIAAQGHATMEHS
jgi:two-component system alkaline phosphatase synthesis response regulator PhoP